VTSKSVLHDNPWYAAENVLELGSESAFWSENSMDEWICWDFGDMRITPTHYRITGWGLSSWILLGSLDGEKWQILARETNTKAFDAQRCWWYRGERGAIFDVSSPGQLRYIKLTPLGKGQLTLSAVEFFGTVRE
jgi:hypothetical protein